ncbi:hypothetical protein [Nocardia puris]|uniref:Uncharacterized protein n=1 Tax=Nocardia puris TaxID=208602 RepID=A0A366CUG4_9NOCA|nr:hypothetical protein [Nocardia puris]RBO79955.1 hypothetical protein DFR74_12931 [Nocardia puris]
MTDTPRVPIPAALHDAPVSAGMVVPHITLAHTDRTRAVFGRLDAQRLAHTWARSLCQVCGKPLTDLVVLYIRPADYLRGLAPEPGVHPWCAAYSNRACPMLAGRMEHYLRVRRDHPGRCEDPACPCAQWASTEPDPREAVREGAPADPWYAVWIGLDDYTVIHDPGDDTTPPVTGIPLQYRMFRALRRISEGGPDFTGPDPLALLYALTTAHRTLRTLTDTD